MTRFSCRLPMAGLLALFIAAGAICLERAYAEESCGEFGTSLTFADSPAQAAKLALKEEKLVFVLHVSGHFEESEYT